MTVIRIKSNNGDDFYYTAADENQVQDAVDELIEEYNALPEDEKDGLDLSGYVLDGLDLLGFDTWRADVITFDADWV